MREKIKTNKKRPVRNLRFLLCDTTDNVERSSPEGQWVPSPIRCLDKAVDEKPGIIVIRFGQMPIKEREVLVELCNALKRNSHTQKYPVLALLHSKNRKLIEDLDRATVDYARYIGEIALNSKQMREIIQRLGPNDRLDHHLEVLCPYLRYSEIDPLHEMAVCGAYLDRMVLGGRWLHEVCETENHRHCEYYLNPRIGS